MIYWSINSPVYIKRAVIREFPILAIYGGTSKRFHVIVKKYPYPKISDPGVFMQRLNFQEQLIEYLQWANKSVNYIILPDVLDDPERTQKQSLQAYHQAQDIGISESRLIYVYHGGFIPKFARRLKIALGGNLELKRPDLREKGFGWRVNKNKVRTRVESLRKQGLKPWFGLGLGAQKKLMYELGIPHADTRKFNYIFNPKHSRYLPSLLPYL